MSINKLKVQLPYFAKDIRLNLGAVVNHDSLGAQTKYGLLLASAIPTRNAEVAAAFDEEATVHLTPEAREAARAAASIMAMNNIYYRFLHLAANASYRALPAKLRISVVGAHGVSKTDFELWSLAVSAINGCGSCINAHEKVLAEAGVPQEAIQTAVRFAAIVQSAAIAIEAARLPVLA